MKFNSILLMATLAAVGLASPLERRSQLAASDYGGDIEERSQLADSCYGPPGCAAAKQEKRIVSFAADNYGGATTEKRSQLAASVYGDSAEDKRGEIEERSQLADSCYGPPGC